MKQLIYRFKRSNFRTDSIYLEGDQQPVVLGFYCTFYASWHGAQVIAQHLSLHVCHFNELKKGILKLERVIKDKKDMIGTPRTPILQQVGERWRVGVSEEVIHSFTKNKVEQVMISLMDAKYTVTYGELIDIRIWRKRETGQWRPTKKGLTYRTSSFPDLKKAILAVDKYLKERSLYQRLARWIYTRTMNKLKGGDSYGA